MDPGAATRRLGARRGRPPSQSARPAARTRAVPGRDAGRSTATSSALQPTGVARYAREVTMALDAWSPRAHPLAADLDLDIVVPGPGRQALAVAALSASAWCRNSRPRLPQFWVQLQLPRHMPGGLVSFCNLAPVSVRRHIACIHDLHTG